MMERRLGGAQILAARFIERINFYCGPSICGPSVWDLLHVTFQTSVILRWLQDFWNICVPLRYTQELTTGDAHSESQKARFSRPQHHLATFSAIYPVCVCHLPTKEIQHFGFMRPKKEISIQVSTVIGVADNHSCAGSLELRKRLCYTLMADLTAAAWSTQLRKTEWWENNWMWKETAAIHFAVVRTAGVETWTPVQ